MKITMKFQRFLLIKKVKGNTKLSFEELGSLHGSVKACDLVA